MVKNIVKAIVVVAAMVGMVGAVRATTAEAVPNNPPNDEHKYTICHRGDSVTNPYQVNSVDYDSIVKQSGHDSHTGPVATSQAVAQALKDSHQKWGDIIPPIPEKNYPGLNWTVQGQAIWNNECTYVVAPEPEGTTSYLLDCEKITLSAPTGVKPDDAQYQYYIDGTAAAVGAHTVTAGGHTITLKVNGVLVDTDEVTVDKCEEPKPVKITICHRTNSVTNPYVRIKVSKSAVDGEGKNDHTHHTGPVATSEAVAQALKDSKTKWGDIIPPFDDYAGYNWTADGQAMYNNRCKFVTVEGQPNVSTVLVCKDSTSTFTMTLTNSGTASANIVLNGESFTLAAGATTTRDFVDNGDGVKLTLVVDGTTDKTYDGSRPFFCKQGQGGVVVTTGGQGAATGVASLPYTGSAGGQIASLIALIASVGTAIGGYVLRNRAVSSL